MYCFIFCLACNDYDEDNTPILVENAYKISNKCETFPHDPALLLCSNISIERFSQMAHQEPCQPKPTELKYGIFPLIKQGNHSRSFHEHYLKKIATREFVRRKWLSYSPTEDKVYCSLYVNNLAKPMENLTNMLDAVQTTGDIFLINLILIKHLQAICSLRLEKYCI